MQAKKKSGSELTVTPDPDEAPLLTDEFFENAEIFEGDTFIQRGRGRPKMVSPKESVNIRLDHDVLALLRSNGPGWQTKVNEMLREALGLKAK